MKFHSSNNWDKSFESDGVLYFSQRCEEMLYHYASEKYKTPVLNTRLLIAEYLSTERLIKTNKISAYNLDYIFDEFKFSFSNDLAIQECWGKTQIDKLISKFGSMNQDSKSQLLKYLQNLMSNKQYYEWCKKTLIKYLKKPREKKKIENLARSIIPEIVANGYTSEYIYYALKRSFILSEIKDYSCIDDFFSFFDFKTKEFNVYFAIDKRSALIMKSVMESRLDISYTDDGYFSKFKIDKRKQVIYFKSVKALDSNAAINKAYYNLNLFIDFFIFISDKKTVSSPQS